MTALSTIYVVSGTCGEYSDRREWTVRAFTTEEAARAYVERLVAQMVALGAGQDPKGFEPGWIFPNRYPLPGPDLSAMHALDPSFSTDYTGTSYDVHPVMLEDVP